MDWQFHRTWLAVTLTKNRGLVCEGTWSAAKHIGESWSLWFWAKNVAWIVLILCTKSFLEASSIVKYLSHGHYQLLSKLFDVLQWNFACRCRFSMVDNFITWAERQRRFCAQVIFLYITETSENSDKCLQNISPYSAEYATEISAQSYLIQRLYTLLCTWGISKWIPVHVIFLCLSAWY